MGRIRVLVAAAGGVLVALGVTAPAGALARDPGTSADLLRNAAAATSTTTRITLDGVTVGLPAGGRQVVTVNHRFGHEARITLWQRDAQGWHVLGRSRDGRIGYGGLVAPHLRKQATGSTPLGTYGLLWAFGTHPRADAWRLDYRMVRAGDYWVEDNDSAYYNRYRNKAEGGFRWWLSLDDDNSSERLRHYPMQYEYSVVISFNYTAPVRHRGAGIFLHVNGPGATAGCVSAPRWFIQRVMATLDPTQRPVIAIGY